jgi:hypothetical protein
MKICNNISCMKQILSTHNPKVVSSNLAPATNNPIIKSNWKGRKARSFGTLSRLRAFLLSFLRTHNIVANMLRTLTIPLPIFGKGIFSSC